MSNETQINSDRETPLELSGVEKKQLLNTTEEWRSKRLSEILDRIIAVKNSPVVSHLYILIANLDSAMYEIHMLCQVYEHLLAEAKSGNNRPHTGV